nr:hypothetical protein RFYW14_01103 [Pseudorhizobium flavum]
MAERMTAWLAEAREAHNYRRMYALALKIVREAGAGPLAQAASCVVLSLCDIIYNPVADAWRLKQARRFFQCLLDQLAAEVEALRQAS